MTVKRKSPLQVNSLAHRAFVCSNRAIIFALFADKRNFKLRLLQTIAKEVLNLSFFCIIVTLVTMAIRPLLGLD